MTYDFAFAWSIMPVLAKAALVTIYATVCGYCLAVTIGLILSLGRIHAPAFVRGFIAFALEFVRSTPILVQVFFLYFVMPRFGIRLPAFETGVLALGLHYGSYLAEVFRDGFQSVKAGQWEAALGLGLRRWQCYRLVILPQIVPPLIPAFGNYLILMFKDTPLLSAISIMELMQTAKIIGSETFRYVEPLSLVAVFFLIMSLVSAALIKQAERYYQRRSFR
jgi:polar amino acid transport system permease protein